MQIAIVNQSKRIDDGFLAFAAKALDVQVGECAAAWGVMATPVAWYSNAENLPQSNCRIMVIVDDLDEPGALGYHTDEGGVVFARVLAQDAPGTSVTLSHECLEELVDPTVDQWRRMPDGKSVALEVCDPVEADTYGLSVEIDGDRRAIALSNYVLPRWFDPAAAGQFDRMGTLSSPFAMTDGGYFVVRDKYGNENDVFARADQRRRVRYAGLSSRLKVAEKLTRGETRIARRLVG